MKQTIHERIHEVYVKLNRTQEYFGDQLGLPIRAVKTLFNGRKKITPEIIKALNNKFWVDAKWLESGEGVPFPNGLPEGVAKAGNKEVGERVRAVCY
jgi:transcriptional regulator with XRE-family HTH domain